MVVYAVDKRVVGGIEMSTAFRCDKCKEYNDRSPSTIIKAHGTSGMVPLELCLSCGRKCISALKHELAKPNSVGIKWEWNKELGCWDEERPELLAVVKDFFSHIDSFGGTLFPRELNATLDAMRAIVEEIDEPNCA